MERKQILTVTAFGLALVLIAAVIAALAVPVAAQDDGETGAQGTEAPAEPVGTQEVDTTLEDGTGVQADATADVGAQQPLIAVPRWVEVFLTETISVYAPLDCIAAPFDLSLTRVWPNGELFDIQTLTASPLPAPTLAPEQETPFMATVICDVAIFDTPGGSPVGTNILTAGQTWFVDPVLWVVPDETGGFGAPATDQTGATGADGLPAATEAVGDTGVEGEVISTPLPAATEALEAMPAATEAAADMAG